MLSLDILESFPDAANISDIVVNNNFVPTSTIYNRFDQLEKSALISKQRSMTENDDIRRKQVVLTDTGLELLLSIYISLDEILSS